MIESGHSPNPHLVCFQMKEFASAQLKIERLEAGRAPCSRLGKGNTQAHVSLPVILLSRTISVLISSYLNAFLPGLSVVILILMEAAPVSSSPPVILRRCHWSLLYLLLRLRLLRLLLTPS